MAIIKREIIQDWFRKGKYPKQEHFWDWLDSFWHKEDDQIPMHMVDQLPEALNRKYNQTDGEELERRMGEAEDRLDDHDTHIANIYEGLADHEERLEIHEDRLDKHDERLDEHDKVLAAHDETLKEHEERITSAEDRLDKHDERLEEHDKVLTVHDEILEDHQERLVSAEETLGDHEKQILLIDTSIQSFTTKGSGNAITSIEHKEDGRTLIATKGNTFVDLSSEQTIAGKKTFQGGIELTHTIPYIDFHYQNSTSDYTSRIVEYSEGNLCISKNLCVGAFYSENNYTLRVNGNTLIGGVLYGISTIYSNKKTSVEDGVAGVVLGAGQIHINSATDPFIRFYRNNSTTITSSITENYAGILSIPGKLSIGGIETPNMTSALSVKGLLTATNINVESNITLGGTVTASFKSMWIPENADLKDYTTPGMYYCSQNVIVATLKNCPTSRAFALLVEEAAGIVQTITEYSSTRIWKRTWYRHRDIWYDWFRVYTTIDPPTLSPTTTAEKLTTARTITFTGWATGSCSFDGSANVICALTVNSDYDFQKFRAHILPAVDRAYLLGNSSHTWSAGYFHLLYTSSVIQSSDIRYKNIIKPLDMCMLDKISTLDVFYYTREEDKEKEMELGVSAQQIQTLFPEFVRGDENGDYLGVDYSRLATVIAIQSTKELKVRIEELEKKIMNL